MFDFQNLDVYRKAIELNKNIYSLPRILKKLKAIYQQKLADLEELKKSVLKKAFAGEL